MLPSSKWQLCNLTRNFALFIYIWTLLDNCHVFRSPWSDLPDNKQIDKIGYLFPDNKEWLYNNSTFCQRREILLVFIVKDIFAKVLCEQKDISCIDGGSYHQWELKRSILSAVNVTALCIDHNREIRITVFVNNVKLFHFWRWVNLSARAHKWLGS